MNPDPTDAELFSDSFITMGPLVPPADSHTLVVPLGEDDDKLIETMRREANAITLMCAFYMSRTGVSTCPLIGEISVAEFAKFSAILSPLSSLSSSCAKMQLSDPIDLVALEKYRLVSSEIIQAALGDVAVKSIVYMTPVSLARYGVDCMGAYCENTWKDDRIASFTVRMPGIADLKVDNPEDGLPWVTEGGQAAVASINNLFKTNNVYLDIDPITIRVALFLNSGHKLVVDKTKTYSLQEMANADPMRLGKIALTTAEQRYVVLFRQVLSEMSKEHKLVMPSSLPLNRDQRHCMLVFLHFMIGHSDGLRVATAKMADMLAERTMRVTDALHSVLNAIIDPAKATMPLLTTTSGPAGAATCGDLKKFREVCHANYRQNRAATDVKKSDSVAGSGAFSSKSSVPYKVQAMVNMLEGTYLAGAEIHAYGVAKANHWELTLASLAKAKGMTVTYLDNDPKLGKITRQGAPIQYANILDIGEGTMKGKYLFDDTCPENPLAKLEVIIRSGCEAGFTKQMYGWGGESAYSTKVVPMEWTKLKQAYSFVEMVQFSPHSEEYFLVFAKARGCSQARWNVFPSIAKHGEQWIDDQMWQRKMQTLRRVKALLIYRANIIRSLEAVAGVQVRLRDVVPKDAYHIPPPLVDKLMHSGDIRPSKMRVDVQVGAESADGLDF